MKLKVSDNKRRTLGVRGLEENHRDGASLNHKPKVLTSATEGVLYDDGGVTEGCNCGEIAGAV